MRSSASSFNFQYLLFSLRSLSSCLRLLPRLPVTSILPSIFPSVTCFRRQLRGTIWPIQFAFLLLIVCRIFLSSLTLCNTSSFLTWLIQLNFSILIEHHISKISGISDLLSEMSITQQYPKCRNSLVSYLNWSPICWWQESSACWMLLFAMASLDLNSRVHRATFDNMLPNSWNIPHFRLLVIYHNLYWGWLPRDSHRLSFFHVHFHSIISSNFSQFFNHAL